MLKAAGKLKTALSLSLTAISLPVKKQEEAHVEPAFSLVIHGSFGNQGNKITSQEVPQKLSFMLCLRESQK
jgi:hypothetical protein